MGLSTRSAGQEAVDLAGAAGLVLDPWQRLFLEHALAERGQRLADGTPTWAALECGLMVSRQNGKGSVLEAYELACLFLFGDRLIIHSAHQFDTSKEAFQRIEALISDNPEFKSEVKRITWSHGEEGIELLSGQRLRFRTRTKGGGRGFTADKVILDEAMYLTDTQLAALLPTMSARPNPQLVLTGSAGDKESTAFGRMRQRALRGVDERLCFFEWSVDACSEFCPRGCTEHDPVGMPDNETSLSDAERERAFVRLVDSYAKANPGLGIRISVEHIESERAAMDPATFAQERLGGGDWPVEGDAWQVISEDAWTARFDSVSSPQGPVCIGIDTSPDRRSSCMVACAFNGESVDGVREVHVEVTGDGLRYDYRQGVDWVVPRAREIAKNRKVVFVIDQASQAGSFVEPMQKHGLTVISPTMREYAQACGRFYSSVVPMKGNTPDLVHLNQPMLNMAVAGAAKRDLADLWAWDKRNSSVDITPLVAATLARFGHDRGVNRPRSRPRAAWGE
ncbi:terminase [Streptomyces sp. 796.1]|uniref:terminase n=1 Tax=Streptomyces sp. 796.1 TaxID=3163029 RepID=UPI0039C8D255